MAFGLVFLEADFHLDVGFIPATHSATASGHLHITSSDGNNRF
jgi:hypothetical protein